MKNPPSYQVRVKPNGTVPLRKRGKREMKFRAGWVRIRLGPHSAGPAFGEFFNTQFPLWLFQKSHPISPPRLGGRSDDSVVLLLLCPTKSIKL